MVRFEDIQTFADEIARRFQSEQIILFGSHAYGPPTEHSDVDLLVVLPHEENPLSKAWQLRRELPDPGFHAYLIVRDPAVLRWRTENEEGCASGR